MLRVVYLVVCFYVLINEGNSLQCLQCQHTTDQPNNDCLRAIGVSTIACNGDCFSLKISDNNSPISFERGCLSLGYGSTFAHKCFNDVNCVKSFKTCKHDHCNVDISPRETEGLDTTDCYVNTNSDIIGTTGYCVKGQTCRRCKPKPKGKPKKKGYDVAASITCTSKKSADSCTLFVDPAARPFDGCCVPNAGVGVVYNYVLYLSLWLSAIASLW